MLRTFMTGKLHKARVTEANLNYVGSITIDEALMEAVGWLENEKVQVVNNNNGERIETYIIKGERHSGTICLNGAAARRFQVDDTIIIISYGLLTKDEWEAHRPLVVLLDESNRISERLHESERAGVLA